MLLAGKEYWWLLIRVVVNSWLRSHRRVDVMSSPKGGKTGCRFYMSQVSHEITINVCIQVILYLQYKEHDCHQCKLGTRFVPMSQYAFSGKLHKTATCTVLTEQDYSVPLNKANSGYLIFWDGLEEDVLESSRNCGIVVVVQYFWYAVWYHYDCPFLVSLYSSVSF